MRNNLHVESSAIQVDHTTSVSQAFDNWLDARAARQEIRANTIPSYRRSLNSFAAYTGPDQPIGHVTTAQFEAWLASRRDLQASSLNALAAPVRTFFHWAVLRQVLPSDPTLPVPRAKARSGPPRRLDAAQVSKILFFADGKTSVCLVLAVQLGLRRAEIAGLGWNDWHAETNMLYVIGKGDKPRYVPVTTEAAKALTWWREQSFSPRWLFPSETAPVGHVLPNTVGLWVKRACVAAGFPEAHTHIFRHTAASHIVAAGEPLAHVQHLLGHAYLSTTGEYVHPTLDEVAASAGGRSYLPFE